MSTSVFSNTLSQDVEDEEPLSMSDLVRAGETSRLRRRGAISGHRARQSTSAVYVGSSVDTSLNATQYQQPNRQFPQAPAVPPPWVDGSSASQSWVGDIVDPTKADDDADGVPSSGYALYCGVETWEFGDEEPYEPSPLPLPFDEPSSPALSPRRIRKSTGCGALIHTSGTPKSKHGTWSATGRASASVVPLDKAYFERGGQSKLFSCGCRWHGVGCSNCGNPLGNVYMPCQVATTTSTLSRDPSQASRRSTAPPNTSAHFHYTFFGDAVSSYPEYEFTKFSTGSMHHNRVPLASTIDSVAQGWDGMSEYPYNYAEQEPDQDQEQEEAGSEYDRAEYDRDGMPITNEPGSPDKPSSETMLWPAR
ncbi:uncharacterized protein FOMMEDRAFT_169792 [Fomitiporia mediterranea MF3/22]|uniref:uncharacterized protein n=1 Tax=Fomitiporia mediterranea (strain MF3/22) TaxID=694068 RepID=UPI0004408801|nr:uncharacterized protein FOMMEDRAFT_169792 [Fomitiporia mediterranea MF3/22]EJD01740.1 hypothetical protein FOMMEDRAFT_169792 [Fomitiporia mediterranea MF3/22]